MISGNSRAGSTGPLIFLMTHPEKNAVHWYHAFLILIDEALPSRNPFAV
jgi:hypothetical protein